MQGAPKSKRCLSIHDLEATTETDERLRDQLILEVLVSHMAIVLRVLSITYRLCICLEMGRRLYQSDKVFKISVS
jgi:hypothetical protein